MQKQAMTMGAGSGPAFPRWRMRRGVFLAVLAAFGGLALLALWGGARLAPPDVPPNVYRVIDARPSPEAGALAARLGAGAEARVMELYLPESGVLLARAEAAVTPDGQAMLLGWHSQGAVPVLRRDIHAAEELRLVEALARYLPEGGTILAMPELSRRLQALTAATAPLAAEAEPLVLPPEWRGQDGPLATAETARWGGPAAPGVAGEGVAAFVDALLAEDVHGAARLRVLAGTGDAYVLVHLEDPFLLGQLREGRLNMARRVFAAESFSHDLAREARSWGQANGHAAWAVDRTREGRLRGHYLTDASETATLIAQLLPFNSSRIDGVPGLSLVWQSGGYWLYRIAPVVSGG